jgi:hypothetical protein
MQPATTAATSHSSSAWSIASWIFFAVAVGAALATGAGFLGSGSISEEGYGPVFKLFLILGAGFAWLATLALAGVGGLCGLIGLLNPSTRTRSAWAATALNAALVAVSFVLMMGPQAA